MGSGCNEKVVKENGLRERSVRNYMWRAVKVCKEKH